MTIQVRTKKFYYCTECDFEYDEEDKKNGDVGIRCSNHPRKEGCLDCMWECKVIDGEDRTYSKIQGCGLWFCDPCFEITYFDAVYPGILCVNCIKKYSIEKFYGDPGRKLSDEIDEVRKSGSMTEEEIEAKYFPGIVY
jgi:hypothetical protein